MKLNGEIERKRAMTNPKLSDFNFDAEALRRYEIDLKNGVFKASDAADHDRMMEALDRIGPLDPRVIAKQYEQAPAPVSVLKSPPLAEAVETWLAERSKKNAPRTVDAKRYHLRDFMKRVVSGDVEVNALTKAVLVGYKSALLTENQTGKTIDNKLMTLHDFFKYMLGHGLYTVSNANPVDGLFVLSKSERVAKNEPFQPFTATELKAFFDPKTYLKAMDTPDFYWAPLIAIHTGMRISEATAIRCQDVQQAENGVHFIFIPKSKTTAGVRNVPISDGLLNLGFLEYVEEVRKAGAERIFPHRLLINGSYSKRLSEKMLAYATEIGIKKPDDHKSFHSFRVNVITALANNGANTPQVMKIVGHKNGDSDETHLGYVRDLPDLKPVVDALKWPIQIESLRYDGRFAEFVGNPKNWADAKKKRARKA